MERTGKRTTRRSWVRPELLKHGEITVLTKQGPYKKIGGDDGLIFQPTGELEGDCSYPCNPGG